MIGPVDTVRIDCLFCASGEVEIEQAKGLVRLARCLLCGREYFVVCWDALVTRALRSARYLAA